MPELYTVVLPSVNVRSQPVITNNVVGTLSAGQQVELVENVREVLSTGYVFRRIVGPTEKWVAEVNNITGQRLLAPVTPAPPAPPIPPIPASSENYVVAGDFVNVRPAPNTSTSVLRQLPRGTEIKLLAGVSQVSPTGWLFRRIAGISAEEWVAEKNVNTGEVLLEAKPTPVPTPPPTPTPPIPTPTPPPTPVPTPTPTEDMQVYIVGISQMNVRSAPNFNAVVVRRVARGTEVTVHTNITKITRQGWVFRKIVSPSEEWIAEFNQQTGERLLRLKGSGARGRVQIDGTRFMLDGKPFRFVGANMRELAFYGQGVGIIRFTNLGHRQAQLDAMQAIGMRVVRLHACHKDVPLDRSLMIMKGILDFIHSYGVLAIVCLNDSLGASEFYIPGDQPFHAKGHPEGHLDKSYFLTNAYQTHYLPFVSRMVTMFKDHPAIFAWELGNEYAIHPQPCTQADADAFVRFAHTAAATIRTLDPNHLITTGLININQIAPTGADLNQFALRLYGSPDIDFATVHFYQDHQNANAGDALEEGLSRIDRDALKTLNKPIVVEEFGSTTGNRAEFTRAKLEQWFGAGASGFMQWALSATGMDIGVGDNLRGMDNYSGSNAGVYQALVNVYRDWANRVKS